MGKPLYTARQFIDAIPGSGGVISTIAARVGCTWDTAKKYIETYPTIKRAHQNEREAILDMGETSLFKAVRDGHSWAVRYMLSTIGKPRGYSERQEVEHTGKVKIVLNWGDDNNND